MRIAWVVSLAVVLAACGSTGDGANAGSGGSGGSGGGSGGGAGDVDGGVGGDGSVPSSLDSMTGSGDRPENAPCTPGAGECGEDLACTGLPLPYPGVCGRACKEDADCTEPDEVCAAYLSSGALICINLVPPWDLFQYDQTSFCDDTSIGIDIVGAPPELRGGLCVQLCLIDGADMSTLTADEISLLQECKDGHACIPYFATSTGGYDEVVGTCATPVDRDGDCTAPDTLCKNYDEDACIPLDLSSATPDWACLQDCTDDSVTCESGTCDPIPGTNGSLCGWIAAGGVE